MIVRFSFLVQDVQTQAIVRQLGKIFRYTVRSIQGFGEFPRYLLKYFGKMASYSLPGLATRKTWARCLGYFRDRVTGLKGRKEGLANYESFAFILTVRKKHRRRARTKNK